MDYIERKRNLGLWILEHTEDWLAICGCGREPMDKQEFFRLYDMLGDSPYTDLQLVLLTCNYSAVKDEIHDYVLPILDALSEIEEEN